MKKNLKYIICIFFMFIIITLFNNSNVIEVETEVKGKLVDVEGKNYIDMDACLQRHGGKLETLKIESTDKASKDFVGKIQRYGNCDPMGRCQGYRYEMEGIINKDFPLNVVYIGIRGENSKNDCFFKFDRGMTYKDETFEYGDRYFYISFNFGYTEKTNIQAEGYISIEGKAVGYNENHVLNKYTDNNIASKGFDFDSIPPSFLNNNKEPLHREYTDANGNSYTCLTVRKADAYQRLTHDIYSCTSVDSNNVCDDERGVNSTRVDGVFNYNAIHSEGNNVSVCALTSDLNPDLIYSGKITLGDELQNQNASNFHQFSLNPNVTKSLTSTQNTQTTSTTSITNKKAGNDDKVVNTDEDDEALGGFGNLAGNSNLECDSGFAEIIDEAWNIILICAPILTILMGTIGFVQALLASDADGIKKASSDLIKRAIALLLLMMLKVIISVILNLFGITICF